MEAALLFPVLCLAILFVLFLALYGLQSGWGYIAAERTSERIAVNWNRSYAHPVTGMYSPLQHDPLYWRLLDDGSGEWSVGTVPLDNGGLALAERKLAGGGLIGWPETMQGKVSFRNGGWSRTVEVSTSAFFNARIVPLFPLPSGTSSAAEETVLEPAEFIRNVDFFIGYLPAVKGKTDLSNVRETLSPWLRRSGGGSSSSPTVEFPTHREAVRYLRTLVRGKEHRIPTEQTGSWRLIDALDGQGIAHQAYIGTSGKHSEYTY